MTAIKCSSIIIKRAYFIDSNIWKSARHAELVERPFLNCKGDRATRIVQAELSVTATEYRAPGYETALITQ
jgi:hypothetical protein